MIGSQGEHRMLQVLAGPMPRNISAAWGRPKQLGRMTQGTWSNCSRVNILTSWLRHTSTLCPYNIAACWLVLCEFLSSSSLQNPESLPSTSVFESNVARSCFPTKAMALTCAAICWDLRWCWWISITMIRTIAWQSSCWPFRREKKVLGAVCCIPPLLVEEYERGCDMLWYYPKSWGL